MPQPSRPSQAPTTTTLAPAKKTLSLFEERPGDPLWQTVDGETVRLYLGDVREVLRALPEKSVQCVVTSPPYWALRDYGTGTWDGGDPKCDHVERTAEDCHRTSTLGPTAAQRADGSGRVLPATNAAFKGNARQFKNKCGKCGAVRVDKQIGSEPSPDCGTHGQAQCGQCFVCTMVAVFREVRRVLRDDGVLWLNLGDTYAGSGSGLPSGNLIGVPWRVALALQADGWILRQDVIWHKPGPMPESVRNRCSKAHEYVFLFAKAKGYFYDAEAIREEVSPHNTGVVSVAPHGDHVKDTGHRTQEKRTYDRICGANKRSVWTVSSQGYPGAHFATFPEKLITPMILAGTSAYGACAECGAPWRRKVEVSYVPHGDNSKSQVKTSGADSQRDHDPSHLQGGAIRPQEMKYGRATKVTDQKGWEPTCECNGRFEVVTQVVERPVSIEKTGGDVDGRDRSLVTNRNGITGSLDGVERETEEVEEQVTVYVSELALEDHPVVPCVVLDPFVGAGTTPVVCIELGRRCWGIDLSKDYLRCNAIPRIEGRLRPEQVPQEKREKVSSGKSLLSE